LQPEHEFIAEEEKTATVRVAEVPVNLKNKDVNGSTWEGEQRSSFGNVEGVNRKTLTSK
jgi:hypothetical protein